MSIVVIAEKPSAARSMKKAFFGTESTTTGLFKGQQVTVVAARGHLYEFLGDLSQMVPKDKATAYKVWDLTNLPWDETEMSFDREPIKGTSSTIRDILSAVASADEVVSATDNDPTGEGDAIFGNIVVKNPNVFASKKITRMYFTDEAPNSLANAFIERVQIPNDQHQHPAYRKADTRARVDLLTGMQNVRAISLCSKQKAVLYTGRLKGPMISLVGEQLELVANYKKIPSYSPRFVDEKGVGYSDSEIQFFKTEAEALTYAQTLGLKASAVVADKVTRKKSAPPLLLNLAGLSGRLAKKGYSTKAVLETYQQMYEAQIVSYPRTEDKVITQEQYDQMLPLVDQIATVVGADTSALTLKGQPRKKHIGPGAHGANRPGMNVPGSLEAIEAKYGKLGVDIYVLLAQSFLVMFAEDYVYDVHAGHIADFPSFIGSVSVPVSQGYRGIFSEAEEDEGETGSGLGTQAEPKIHESFPPRPASPTFLWLEKQLSKHRVGTGATQSSTFASISESKGDYPQMSVDKKGKISLTQYGEMTYLMMKGSRIGSVNMTEWLLDAMDKVADGTMSTADVLAPIKDWLIEDIEVFKRNAVLMKEKMGLTDQVVERETFTGFMRTDGSEVKINRLLSGHRFTDDEIEALLGGAEIGPIGDFVSAKTGNTFSAKVKLQDREYKGKVYSNQPSLIFEKREVDTSVYAVGTFKGKEVKFKKLTRGYTLTEQNITDLLTGKEIGPIELKKKDGSGTYPAVGTLALQSFTSPQDGKLIKFWGVDWQLPARAFPKSFSGYTFSPGEAAALQGGEKVSIDQLVSKKKGTKYTGILSWDAKNSKMNMEFPQR